MLENSYTEWLNTDNYMWTFTKKNYNKYKSCRLSVRRVKDREITKNTNHAS